jgi:hypothetical protein
MQQIRNPEVLLLASIAAGLEQDYVRADVSPWDGSPFEWILRQSSRRRGAIGEKLVAGWSAAKDFDVLKPRNSDADRIINNVRVEIKTSTLWENGQYKFQQIRDQEYDFLFALGISPFDAHAWLIPKHALMNGRKIGLTGQHTGAQGTDTSWLGFRATTPPDWLDPYGGSLSKVFELLKSARVT